ncbi:MAG TPA: hypothetical protein VFB78_03520 [Acidimicrobiales bacterium]|nr:hypothetical protein [Acidimicrobiales bacterium]
MTDRDDEKHRILQRVADGSLSPSEAAERLAALEADTQRVGDDAPTGEPSGPATGGRAGAAPSPAPATAGSSEPTTEVRIRGTFRAVEVIGDPSVHEASADGRHVAHHDGGVLVIDGGGFDLDDDDDEDDFDWFRFTRGQGYRRMGMRLRSSANTLQVRMNPDLALDAKVEAGPLTIRQVHGPIKARVSAGPLKIEEFAGPLDLHVAAGPIKARGTLDHGDSHIQCEAGSVNLHLTHGSSVRVKASATLGKVNLFGERDRDRDHDRGRDRGRDFHWEDLAGPGMNRVLGDVFGRLGGSHEATVGGGEGTLDVEVAMGAVHLSAD